MEVFSRTIVNEALSDFLPPYLEAALPHNLQWQTSFFVDKLGLTRFREIQREVGAKIAFGEIDKPWEYLCKVCHNEIKATNVMPLKQVAGSASDIFGQ